MPEYIEREFALGMFDNIPMMNGDTAKMIIACIPAADVASVVLCRDCKNEGDEENCPLLRLVGKTMPDDFCSYGERRADNGF